MFLRAPGDNAQTSFVYQTGVHFMDQMHFTGGVKKLSLYCPFVGMPRLEPVMQGAARTCFPMCLASACWAHGQSKKCRTSFKDAATLNYFRATHFFGLCLGSCMNSAAAASRCWSSSTSMVGQRNAAHSPRAGRLQICCNSRQASYRS